MQAKKYGNFNGNTDFLLANKYNILSMLNQKTGKSSMKHEEGQK